MTSKEPKIRFNGCADDWKQYKLKEVAEFNPKSILPDQFEYVDLESVSGTNLVSHRTEQKETAPSRAQRLAKRGDVFYQTVRPYQKNNYFFDLPYDNYVFSTGYAQMRPNIDSHFLLSRIQEEKFVSNVLDRCTGTSYPAINSSDLAQIEIGIPTLLEEQTKIGRFFKRFDDTITLHQSEYKKFINLKRAMLQKMFPKNGKYVPEIRFEGFTDDWEQPNILEICRVFIGLVTTMTENYRETGTLLIRNSDIKENKFEFAEQPIHLEESFAEKNNSRRLAIGDVVTVHTGDIGTSAVITEKENGSIGFATINSRPNPKFIDSDYLATFLNTERHKNYAVKMSTGDGRSNYNLKDFNRLIVPVPSIEEQRKIGKFFKELNNTISLHQEQLNKLQQIKKSMLQKMFI